MMSALGQYLLQHGWIDREQLRDALAHQQKAGGRLGTSLLEKGHLGEERLLEALAARQEAPVATAEDLADIAPDVIQRLSAKIASRHLAIPFRASDSRIDVALARADDLARLDELSFAAGKSLRPHLAVEARLYHALETYYQVPCPPRFRTLVDRLDRESGKGSTPPGGPGSVSPDTRSLAVSLPAERPKSGPRRSVRDPQPPARRTIPLTEDQRLSLEPTVPSPQTSLAKRLAAAGSTDAVGGLLLAALEEHFVRSILFRVSRHSVSGWLGHGPDVRRDELAGYSSDLRQPTVFRQVDRDGLFRGALVASPSHDELARCWGGGLEDECLIVAVRVRGRMVCALYGDRGPFGLGGLDVGAVEQIASNAGLAFERLILERKLRR